MSYCDLRSWVCPCGLKDRTTSKSINVLRSPEGPRESRTACGVTAHTSSMWQDTNQEEELTWHHQRPAQDSGDEHFIQLLAIPNHIPYSTSLNCKVLRTRHKKADKMFSLSIRARNLKTDAPVEENCWKEGRKLHKRLHPVSLNMIKLAWCGSALSVSEQHIAHVLDIREGPGSIAARPAWDHVLG